MRVMSEQRGVTLVEMMVVIVLSGLVMGASLTTFTQFEQTTGVSERQNDARDQVRVGLAGLARELRNLASPTDEWPDAVVRAAPDDVVFQSVSSSATRRVRYCLNSDSSRLWRQVQYEPFTDPSSSVCPDSSWGSERAAVENVVNGSRPVFAYNSAELTAITEIGATLWVDVDPGAPPLETTLQTSIFLRNQNRTPTAHFTANVSGSTVILNGSQSQDPEGKELEFYWYDEAMSENQCEPLPDEVPPTGCVGTGIVFHYQPPGPECYDLYVVVRDSAGLTGTATSEEVLVEGEGASCP